MRSSKRALVAALVLLYTGGTTLSFADDINVNGSHGTPGQNGSHGGSGGSGGDGGNGAHGTNGTGGTDAGNIDVRLLTPTQGASRGVVQVQGTFKKANGQTEKVDKKVSDNLTLEAQGGNGGIGGNGGRGGDGGRGSDGSSATSYSSGTDGSHGGDGGRGGNGGRGANGGNGGRITVRAAVTDTHWLMLVKPAVRSGAGGTGGTGGSGGNGGRGGSGGSSYSWSESIPYTESVSSTDSDGNTTYSTVTNYRTEFHSNPGGSDGRSGSAGSSGTTAPDANDGVHGVFEIAVTYGDGSVRTYRDRYDVHLESFQIEDANADGIYEPGEKVTMKKITVKNTGKMPTPPPPSSFVEISIAGDGWVMSDGVPLQLPVVLEPGQSYTFEDKSLVFHLRDTKDGEIPRAGSAFRVGHSISPRAVVSVVDRELDNFKNPVGFKIEFPIEIKPIRALSALRVGEATRVFFEVTNISKRDFGSASDLKRRVALMLRGKGEEGAFDLQFTDPDGKPIALEDGALKAIDHLKAGESRVIEGVLTANKDVDSHTAYEIGSSLQLGLDGKPDTTREIQTQSQRILVVRSYKKSKDADVLLVTNGASTKEELRAWGRLLGRHGMKANLWNLSYYGYLDFAKAFVEHDADLLEDFRGKTIILLNNTFNSDANTPIAGHDLVAKRAFLKALDERGINFLVLGRTQDAAGRNLIESFVLPTEEAKHTAYKSIDAFYERFGRGQETFARGETLGQRAEFSSDIHRIKLSRAFYWSKPKETIVEDTAREVRAWLAAQFPHRKFVVVHEFDPKVTREGGTFSSSQVDLGSLLVRQIADGTENAAMSVALRDDQVHNPEYVDSLENARNLYGAFSFEGKLKALDKLIGQLNLGRSGADGVPYAEALVDIMLADIAAEQRAALTGFFRREPGKRQPSLARLAEYQFRNRVIPGKASEALLTRLTAGVWLMARHSWSYWSYLTVLPVTNGRATKAYTYHYIETWAQKQYEAPAGWSAAKPLVRTRVDELLATARAGSTARKTTLQEAIYALMETPLKREGVTAAATVWADYAEKAMPRTQYAAAVTHDTRVGESCAKVIAAIGEAKTTLAVND